jgi:MerR family redox-sensitive transcriptional activator SoxR
MANLRIGEVAQQAGIATSALRYYEKVGLLPAPARVSKRRQYDQNILGRIRIILLARDAGFSVSETRSFFKGFPVGTTPARRWREMAERKLAELNRLIERIEAMKAILRASFNCECRELSDCERLIVEKNRCGNTSTNC